MIRRWLCFATLVLTLCAFWTGVAWLLYLLTTGHTWSAA